MVDEASRSQYRFERDVRERAPKPGHHLATASYVLGGESVVLWVVEGPENDAMGFIGMATDFTRTRLLRFSLRGSLIEQLNGLPSSPCDRRLTYRFSNDWPSKSPSIVVKDAISVFSSVRAPGRAEPDGAAVAYSLETGDQVVAAITGYQRGWYWQVVVVSVGLSLWVMRDNPAEGAMVVVTCQQDAGRPEGVYEVSGAVTYRASTIAAPAHPSAIASTVDSRGNGVRAESKLARSGDGRAP